MAAYPFFVFFFFLEAQFHANASVNWPRGNMVDVTFLFFEIRILFINLSLHYFGNAEKALEVSWAQMANDNGPCSWTKNMNPIVI